jgi:hypothetical protein
MIVPSVEREVRIHEPHGGAHCLTDRGRLRGQIVLETAGQPTAAAAILEDHEPQSFACHDREGSNLGDPPPGTVIGLPA